MAIPIEHLKYYMNVESYQYFRVGPDNEIFLAKVIAVDEKNKTVTLELKNGKVSIVKKIDLIIEVIIK